MNRALGSILVATAVAVGGCKADNGKVDNTAGSSATPNSALREAPSAEASSDARPLIVCFGDSLTAGLGIDDPMRTYPADLARLLRADGYDYRVVNAGVSGETTKDGLARVGRVVARKPQVVVLEFGGNDGLRGLPPEDTERNLGAMIERLQGAGITVALAGITLPPQYGGDYIARFNAMYPRLAAKYRVPLLPMLLVHVYDVPGDMQADGVHPTAQGAQQVAVNVEQVVKPLLRK